MNTESRHFMVRLFCLGAGLMDAASGVLLVFAPTMTLRLMQVGEVNAGELVYIRFVGAFVFGVGCLYLFAVLDQYLRQRMHFTAAALFATGWIRLCVCIFTTVAILAGTLSWRWLSVPLTDGLLALFQFGVLASGWIRTRE